MKIKSLLITFLIVAVTIVCIACDNGSGDDTTTAATTTAATTQATSGTSTTAAPVVTTVPEETSTEPEVTTVFAEEDFSIPLAIKAPATKTPAASYQIWDGSVATSFAGGDGTAENPYLISSGAQLAYLAYLTNSSGLAEGAYLTQGVYYKLTNDIYLNDVSNYASWTYTNAPANVWTPIGINMGDNGPNTKGGDDNYFAGIFDGAGYTVFGIYTSKDGYYAGLFGNVRSSVATSIMDFSVDKSQDPLLNREMSYEICDVIIKNVNVSHSYIAYYYYGGGILGFGMKGVLVSNCHVDATVTSALIPTGPQKGGNGGIMGRGEMVYLYRCTSAAKSFTIPVLLEDGTWAYGYFHGGLASVLAGVAEECGSFGDVYVTCAGGLGFGYLGASSMGTRVYNCVAEGTLYSGWDLVDTSVYEGKNISSAGLFAGRTDHVDCWPFINVEKCVSGGTLSLDIATVNNFGRFAGLHGNIDEITNVMYVNDSFDDTTEIIANWSTKNLFWSNVFEFNRADYEALRAKY